MYMKKNDNLARKTIENAKKIAIFWHMSPDGDCIGSMLWLGRLLEKQKKQISYFVPNKPSKIFWFVKNIKRLKSNFDYKNYDLLIFVDFTWVNRMWILGQVKPDYFKQKPLIIFDHHPGDEIDHGIVIKDSKSISTCEILFEHTHKWWPEIYDKEIATYFYLGITSDSGNFLFEEDHIRTFSNVVKLLKLGADKDFVVNNLLRKKSFNSIRFLQLLLNRMKQKDDLLYTYYDERELEEYNIDLEEAAYALHIIQNIDGPKIVLLISKRGDVVRWSLRARKPEGASHNNKFIDCNKIASTLWWWWHKFASGFGLPATGNFEQQIEKIVQHINKIVKTEK